MPFFLLISVVGGKRPVFDMKCRRYAFVVNECDARRLLVKQSAI